MQPAVLLILSFAPRAGCRRDSGDCGDCSVCKIALPVHEGLWKAEPCLQSEQEAVSSEHTPVVALVH